MSDTKHTAVEVVASATSEQLEAARAWCEDSYGDMPEDASDLEVVSAVVNQYEGGWAAFLADGGLEGEPDVWEMLESPPKGCEDVAAMWSWSMNYDPGKGPATLFLDLIGYSEDEYGETMYKLTDASLGYMELDYLADALKAYTADPSGVRSFVSTLLEKEGER